MNGKCSLLIPQRQIVLSYLLGKKIAQKLLPFDYETGKERLNISEISLIVSRNIQKATIMDIYITPYNGEHTFIFIPYLISERKELMARGGARSPACGINAVPLADRP